MQASTITSKVGTKILLEHSFMVGLVGVRRGLVGVRAAAKAQIIACRSITPSCTARLTVLGKWGRGFATSRAGKGLTAGEHQQWKDVQTAQRLQKPAKAHCKQNGELCSDTKCA